MGPYPHSWLARGSWMHICFGATRVSTPCVSAGATGSRSLLVWSTWSCNPKFQFRCENWSECDRLEVGCSRWCSDFGAACAWLLQLVSSGFVCAHLYNREDITFTVLHAHIRVCLRVYIVLVFSYERHAFASVKKGSYRVGTCWVCTAHMHTCVQHLRTYFSVSVACYSTYTIIHSGICNIGDLGELVHPCGYNL